MLSEEKQLQAFINFIKNDSNGNKYTALKAKDWATFAKFYNGSSYAQNQYDTKLEKNYSDNVGLNK